jgi:hypothetical protein
MSNNMVYEKDEKTLEQRHVELANIESDHIYDATSAESSMVQNAIAFGEAETKLPLRQLARLYAPAALWSMVLSTALIMDGMDTGLGNYHLWAKRMRLRLQ